MSGSTARVGAVIRKELTEFRRNRLIVTYVFIGVIPAVLLVAMASITTATMTAAITGATVNTVTAITTEMRFVGGTTITAIICRQGLPRETGCRRDWKGSYGCAERCPRDCVRKWWRARWNSKGVCLHLRQAMETLLSADTSFS